jgi:mono/diheme cytochrome c family protein
MPALIAAHLKGASPLQSARSAALAALALLLAACGTGDSAPPTPPAASSAALEVSPPSPPITEPRCAPRSPRRLERAAVASASAAIELVQASGALYALVADHDERALHVVDAESMKQISVTPLSGRPGHVLALADGRVAVTLRDAARVLVLEPADDALTKPFEERCAATVAAEPWSLAEAGDRLLIGSGFGATLTALRTRDLTLERAIPLPREPRAVLVTDRGKTAFVAHAVGGLVSALALDDLYLQKPPEIIRLHAGRRVGPDGNFDAARPRDASQGYALASIAGTRKDGERGELRIFAPHTSIDPGASDRGESVGYGGGGDGPRPVAPIVSVLDPVAKRSITNHVAGAFNATDCFLPRAAIAHENSLFVACLDLGAVLELDPWLGDPMAGERRRFTLPAGPSALALTVDGKRLLAFSELDRAVSRVEIEDGSTTSTVLWRRAGERRDPRIERGRRLFHASRDARIATNRACATCHPEGRDDGLLWTSPDGPRQTPMLAGRLAGTEPYGWFGENPTVRDHVEKTFTRLGGTGLGKQPGGEDLDALLAYVAELSPPPSTPPADVAAASRGKKAFLSYGCNDCHKDGATDGRAHDVGAAPPGSRRRSFDTPSLRGVRGSAPYFHDGRYATLDELLSAKDTRMFAGVLSEPDKRDLIAYLETL